MYETLDSGKRETFAAGSVRDKRKSQGRFDLISHLTLLRLVQLYVRGSKKYRERNWEKDQPLSWYLVSAMRDLAQWIGGDPTEDHSTASSWSCFAYIQTEKWV